MGAAPLGDDPLGLGTKAGVLVADEPDGFGVVVDADPSSVVGVRDAGRVEPVLEQPANASVTAATKSADRVITVMNAPFEPCEIRVEQERAS